MNGYLLRKFCVMEYFQTAKLAAQKYVCGKGISIRSSHVRRSPCSEQFNRGNKHVTWGGDHCWRAVEARK